MMRTRTFHTLIALTVLVNVALGITNWVITPQYAWRWFAGIMYMPSMWIFVIWALNRRPLSQYSITERRFFIVSVLSASLLIFLAFSLRVIEHFDVFNMAAIDRAWGIGIGLFLAALGNTLPKVLGPLSAKQCAGSEKQSVQRFAGWAFALAGLMYAVLWMFASIKLADAISIYIVMAALALVVLRYLWAMRPRII
ncbi:MAG: hypothetical protein COA84_04435 [Robiginitomaculum sp.]|nr:MAG: hypothetical protein COA84_04435 [Robiginitomaculum sp.]